MQGTPGHRRVDRTKRYHAKTKRQTHDRRQAALRRERRWNESRRHGRAVSDARERAAASTSRRSGSKPQSSVEVRSDAPTLFDGVFKRPYPVFKKPRREKAQPPASRATVLRTASQRKATVPSPQRASFAQRLPRLNAPRVPALPVSHYLTELSEILNEQLPLLFQQPTSFRVLVLDIRRAICDEPAAGLDTWCSHRPQGSCWLVGHRGQLNKLLFFYGIECAEIHPGSLSINHVGSGFPKREDAEGILDKAREMFVDPQQFLYERECVIMWLLRVHRCIERLRLDLTDIAESPDEFCSGWRLHRGYRVVELGVSGRISPSGHRLFSILGHVTLLTELSLFGLYLMGPDDNVRLAALVTENMFLRKLSLTRCHMDARNLDGLVEATTCLPFFEFFSISLQNPHSWVERGEQLSRLLATTGPRRLRRAYFGDGCHLKPLLKRLRESKNVVEVQITQELFSPSDLITLCDVAQANTTLERLFLSIDMDRAVPSRHYQFVLTRFVGNANMDILKLDNSFFTTSGVRAVAEGLKRNGTVEMQRPDTEEGSTLNRNGQQGCLKQLYLRGDNLTCEHVCILVDALDGNSTLEILDVGYAQASAKVSDADVTQKIIDDAIRQYHRAVISQSNYPTAAARVNKVYFAEDIPLLISAIRKDVTFRKLILSFCDVPEHTIQRQSSEFSRFLALLHFFAVRDTLEVLDVNVSSPGVSDVAFLGLSLLVATSKNLTELSIELADTCSDFASVLLLQGLASSTFIRSLIMSGWRLEHPVPLWFDHFCRMNESLRKLHIHVTCLEDEANTVFLAALPDTLSNCAWLVDFRLTCGELREPVFIPEVQSFLRVNKKLNPYAVMLVKHAARMPEIVVQYCDKRLNLYTGVTLRRAMELPDFKQALLESFMGSTDEIERAINKTKSLVSSALGRRAKIHRRLSVAGPTLDADQAGRSGSMDEATQERIFKNFRLRGIFKWYVGDENAHRYQMPLSNVAHEMRTIYNEENQLYESSISKLRELFGSFAYIMTP